MKGTGSPIAAAFQILASKKEDISILVKADIFILGRQSFLLPASAYITSKGRSNA
jgi:hypothetical protein